MLIIPKATYEFNTVPIKILLAFIFINRTKVLKFIWNYKRSQIPKIILRKKNKAEALTLPDFKTLQSYSNQNSMVLA